MAFTCKDISVNTLENTISWYFTPQQLSKANDAIVNFTGKLKVGNLFRKEKEQLHTSSDGQKFYIQVDSIHANYSYKYFGNEKGIVLSDEDTKSSLTQAGFSEKLAYTYVEIGQFFAKGYLNEHYMSLTEKPPLGKIKLENFAK